MFPIYPSDFALEVAKITTDGLSDVVLKVNPREHPEQELADDGKWSDFAWAPVCSLQDFNTIAAIVFVAVSAAGSADGGASGGSAPTAPKLPTWLAQDLGALPSQSENHGGKLITALQCMKRTAHNAVARRALDPVIVRAWLRAASSSMENPDPKEIIRRYNAQVFYSKRLIIADRMVSIQMKFLDP